MVKIDENLIRKRAEHNEGEIFSLEEIALHQQNIEKIEFLDKFCRKLKILYLQNNLIPKLENLNKLKDLEYLNLALNNIERIENLDGCESLNKLDLTVNFIGDLQSIENLINLEHLRELFLTGNPCVDFVGYREFVIATLPQLKSLDGIDIGKSERIIAFQNLHRHNKTVVKSQKDHYDKRQKEKGEYTIRKEQFAKKLKENNGNVDALADEFWHSKNTYTPESRIETHEFSQLQKNATPQKTNKDYENEQPKKKRRLFFAEDGRPYSINEAKIDFKFEEKITSNEQCFLLDLAVYKHMDTSLIDCDIQVNYVRVTFKGKIFQMPIPEEIHPDKSTVQRSQATGRLLVRMPKVKMSMTIHPVKYEIKESVKEKNGGCAKKKSHDYLEIGECQKTIDWRNILDSDCGSRRSKSAKQGPGRPITVERCNSPDFVDDPSVPPLI